MARSKKIPAGFSCFDKSDIAKIKKLNTPHKLQEFVDRLKYHYAERNAPLDVLRKESGDCFDAAMFACAVLRFHGYPSFLMDFRAYRDEDHVLCVFKVKNRYGAIAKSKFVGLRFRNPVYLSLRELAMSYFHHYFDYNGKITLREYSDPFYPEKHCKHNKEWLYNNKLMYRMEREINHVKHHAILDRHTKFYPMHAVDFVRAIMIMPSSAKVAKRYRPYMKKLSKIKMIKH